MVFEQEIIFTGLKTGKKADGKDWYLVGFKSNNVYWSCFSNKTTYEYLSKIDKDSSILGRFNLLYDYKSRNLSLYLSEVL